MKKPVFISILLSCLALIPPVFASTGNSGATVKIDTSVNSQNNSIATVWSETRVNINQTGDGTSEVRINGQTWKQEGPGTISVNQSSSSTSSPSPTSSPSNNPSLLPDPTPSPSVSSEPDDEGIASAISEFIENIKEFFSNLF